MGCFITGGFGVTKTKKSSSPETLDASEVQTAQKDETSQYKGIGDSKQIQILQIYTVYSIVQSQQFLRLQEQIQNRQMTQYTVQDNNQPLIPIKQNPLVCTQCSQNTSQLRRVLTTVTLCPSKAFVKTNQANAILVNHQSNTMSRKVCSSPISHCLLIVVCAQVCCSNMYCQVFHSPIYQEYWSVWYCFDQKRIRCDTGCPLYRVSAYLVYIQVYKYVQSLGMCTYT